MRRAWRHPPSGGEIVASALVHALVERTGEFLFEDAREVEMKGVHGLQRVYPLAGASVRCESVVRGGSGHACEIQRVDQRRRRSDLAAAVRTEESSEPFLIGPSTPLRLALEGPEGLQLALSLDDPLNGVGAEGADQLVLQIFDAHEEPERFHLGAREVGAQAGSLEAAAEVSFLRRVTQARQPDVDSRGTVMFKESSDVLRAPDRDDGHALGSELTTSALGKRLERTPVTGSLDQNDLRDRRHLLRPMFGSSTNTGICLSVFVWYFA